MSSCEARVRAFHVRLLAQSLAGGKSSKTGSPFVYMAELGCAASQRLVVAPWLWFWFRSQECLCVDVSQEKTEATPPPPPLDEAEVVGSPSLQTMVCGLCYWLFEGGVKDSLGLKRLAWGFQRMECSLLSLPD